MDSVTSNPIIPGFAPDPSVILIDDTFFLVTSSFHLFPGLPLYTSQNLRDWQHVGNAINRPDQLSLAGSVTNLKSQGLSELVPATGGLYAPTIRHHKGKTYIICTNVVHDPNDESTTKFNNFLISTSDPFSGVWSDPVEFDMHGIDPDIFFDEDSRVYVTGSIWRDETTINCFEINVETGDKLSEERVISYGYTKVIPEGPHLYRRGGWIYLLAAEGGTHEGHCITVFRSRSVFGPFESYDKNPILKPSLPGSVIEWNGHGDLFQDQHGDWFMVCLGARRDGRRCFFGRETFLAPVTWNEDDWPSLSPIELNLSFLGDQKEKGAVDRRFDIAGSSNLMTPFVWLRDSAALLKDCQITKSKSGVDISLSPSTADLADGTSPTTFIGMRSRRHGTSSTYLNTTSSPTFASVKAGLGLYKDEHRFARIYWDARASTVVCEFVNRAKSRGNVISVKKSPAEGIHFNITYNPNEIHFGFRTTDMDEYETVHSLDVEHVSGPDFVGPVIGVFATCDNPIDDQVVFKNFSID